MYPPPQSTPPRSGPPWWLLPTGIGCGGLILILVVLGIIGAVAGDPVDTSPPAETTAAVAPAKTTAPPARAVPSPDAAEQAAYLAALERIDPGLTVNTERVMRRAGRVCERIVRPPGGNLSLEQYVVLELSGGNATIDEGQAREVIKAVRVWCR